MHDLHVHVFSHQVSASLASDPGAVSSDSGPQHGGLLPLAPALSEHHGDGAVSDSNLHVAAAAGNQQGAARIACGNRRLALVVAVNANSGSEVRTARRRALKG